MEQQPVWTIDEEGMRLERWVGGTRVASVYAEVEAHADELRVVLERGQAQRASGEFGDDGESICDCCGARRPVGWAGICRPCWDYIEKLPTPPAPTEALPPGVHEAPDGTLLAKPKELPEGWQMYYQHQPGGWRWTDADEIRCDAVFRHVRPVPPVPETEEVGLHELIGRFLPGEDRKVSRLHQDSDGRWTATTWNGGTPPYGYGSAEFDVDESGRVAVLRSTEGEEAP